MSKKKDFYFIFLLTSFISLLAAAIFAILRDHSYSVSLIPHPDITLPLIHFTCAILCLISMFKREWNFLQYSILFIESAVTTLTSYHTLGAFLYVILISLLFRNGFFLSHRKLKLLILIVVYNIVAVGVYRYGMTRMIMNYFVAYFMFSFVFFFYYDFKSNLYKNLPVAVTKVLDNKINLPPFGSDLELKKFNLTELQIEIIHKCVIENLTYEQIAEIKYMSTSKIKTEMSNILKTFNLSNKNELILFLSLYHVIY